MATNRKDLKSYVRYDGSGRVIPGSNVLRKNMPKVGKWKETQAYECCNPTPLPSNWMEMDITTQFGISPEQEDVTLRFFLFQSTSTTITVDWGDGTQFSGLIDFDNYFVENHSYPERGVKYTIRVCFSNIENIRELETLTGQVYNEETNTSTYSNTQVRGIKNFTSLEQFDLYNQNFPSFDISGMNTLIYADFEYNALLSYVNFGGGLPNLDWLGLDNCNFSGSFDCTIFPSLRVIQLNGNNLVSINLSNLLSLKIVQVYDIPNLSNLNITGSPLIRYIYANNCAIPTIQVDSILVQLDTNGVTDGTVELSGGTNGIPTATGLAAKISLEGKGWTVTVNS
jgi:hypothetical protein